MRLGDFLAARIKRNRKTQQIKFKVRCNRFIYTLVLKDSDKADKLKQSLPPCAFSLLIRFPAETLGWLLNTILTVSLENSSQGARRVQG